MTGGPRVQVYVLLAIGIACVSRSTDAAAPGGARIVVMTVGLDGKARPQLGLLEHAAQVVIARAGRFELMASVDAFDPAALAAREAAVRAAATRMAEGQWALDDLEDSKATAAFNDALSSLRQTNVANGFELLIKAWVFKAASLASGGETALAREELEKIIALSPRAELPQPLFGAQLLQYVETQRRIAGNAKGELTVRTEPSGAAVWVDGQYRGVSPTLVKNLTGGRHLVTATLGGYALGQEALTLGEGLVTLQPAQLHSELSKARDLVSRDPDGLTREQAAMTLGARVGAQQVLLLIAKKSLAGEQLDLTAVRLDVKDGHNLGFQTAVVPMNNEPTASSVLELVVSGDALRVSGRPVFHSKPVGVTLSGKRAAGLVLLGAGAALVSAGVFSGLQAQSTVSAYRTTPQVETGVSAALAVRGRSFSIVADVSFVVAAASLAIGTFFVASGGSGSSVASSSVPEVTPAPEAHRDSTKAVAPPAHPTPDDSARRESEARAAKEAEAKREQERKAREAAESKKREDDAKKAPRKEDDHDDLRNY